MRSQRNGGSYRLEAGGEIIAARMDREVALYVLHRWEETRRRTADLPPAILTVAGMPVDRINPGLN
jgi:hypothetical protein